MTTFRHVTIVTPEFKAIGGGISTFYRQLVEALAAEGVCGSVIEAHPFAAPAEGDIAPGWRLYSLDRTRLESAKRSFSHLEAMPRLRRELSVAWTAHEVVRTLSNTQVVEATDYGLLSLPFLLAPIAPVVMQCHGSIGQIGHYDSIKGMEAEESVFLGLETVCVELADACQSYSEANANYWTAQSRRRVISIYPTWTGASSESEPVQDRIAVVGRIQRWKGPQVVCEALDRMTPQKTPIIEWYGRDVAINSGGATTGDWLKSRYGGIWGKRVVAKGPATLPEVAQIQASSRLNLVPSTWDVFNFTVVEAMYSGRPVVCSSKAGASKLIDDGVTGFTYDGSSADALAETLSRALAVPESELRRIGAAARHKVASTLSSRENAMERLSAYDAAASSVMTERTIPDWVRLISVPREPAEDSHAFLSQVPTKTLVQHATARILDKLFRRA